ncbi:MAG: hypothetical protein Aurels2KO_23920 [Aureliella sp.]
MNALSQIGKQIGDVFASMTPQARIMAGLMAGVILVSLGWIFSAGSSTQYEPLLGGSYTAEQLDAMEVAFSEAGLRGHTRMGKQIKIPTAEKDLYLAAVEAAGALPSKWGTATDAAHSSGGMFDSPLLQTSKLQTARERELAVLLKGISGIEDAAVSYDEKKTAFMRDTERVCSIFVRAPFGQEVDSRLLRSIALQAKTHFAGLTDDNISVFDQGSGRHYQPSADQTSIENSPLLMAQMLWEDKVQTKVRRILGQNYGNIQVGVAVELDSMLSSEEEKLTYDSTTVPIQSSTSTKNEQNQKSTPAGPPGARPNEVTSNGAASLSAGSPDQTSSNKVTEEQKRAVAGHTVSRTKEAGLAPTKVTVSVGIPDTYYKTVWQKQKLEEPDADAENLGQPAAGEIEKIMADTETNLRLALASVTSGIRAGLDPKPLINIFTFPELPVEPLPEPGFSQAAMGWLAQSWTTLALLVVLLVSLGMMFSWVKSQGDIAADKDFAEGFGLQIPDNLYDELDVTDEEGGEDGDDRKVEFQVTGGELKDDLSTLIKDNPDVAVNLLKTWIGDAA